MAQNSNPSNKSSQGPQPAVVPGVRRKHKFIIRDEQIEIIRQRAINCFESELLAHLLEHYPESCAAVGTEAEVRAFVQRGVERALQYGIETNGGITIYVELVIQYGENFERSPLREWARNILAHPLLPGHAKAVNLRERHEELTEGRIVVQC